MKLLLLFLVMCYGCSLTKKLPETAVLYTGVKRILIECDTGVQVPAAIRSALKEPLEVLPNGAIFSSRIRSPFQVQLRIWNWTIHKRAGLKWWIYRKFSKEPILLSDVQPEIRLKMSESVARTYGYFGVTGDYIIEPHKYNKKKAKIKYILHLPEPYHYSSIKTSSTLIDTLWFNALHVGKQYNLSQLEQVRRTISDSLRDKGYYYFEPSFIEYMADTVGRAVDLTITIKRDIPSFALEMYRINQVNVTIAPQSLGSRDTLLIDSIRILCDSPAAINPSLVANAVKLRSGMIYSASTQRQTQAELARLNVFRYAALTVLPLAHERALNMDITADYALTIETDVEISVASTSNDLIGPGISLGVTNRNLFRRAENLSFRLIGSYEWQVGGGEGLDNSYELGTNVSLSIPRLMGWNSKYVGRTYIETGCNFINRSEYFRMMSVNERFTWEYKKSFRVRHTITPFRLVYTRLLSTTHKFDSIVSANPSLALSFRDQFIPSMEYVYTYVQGKHAVQRQMWKLTMMQAGNLTYASQYLLGKRGSNLTLLGQRYSQFLRSEVEWIGHRGRGSRSYVAMRILLGIGWAYGNSDVMPYSEQFYIGGANSIRAFRIRSIGPGSYHTAEKTFASYLGCTGDMKMELNIGYRYRISGRWNGAFFVDAGNVWLLRNNSERPGGELRWNSFFKEIALGTGFGIRYDLTYVILRMDLGIALHAPYDTGHNGYFNMRRYNFQEGLVLNFAIGYPF